MGDVFVMFLMISWDELYHRRSFIYVFFFNDTATTEIYTLSLHDALPIYVRAGDEIRVPAEGNAQLNLASGGGAHLGAGADRKSTRLNSSHLVISYAVFCLKKKNTYRKMINAKDSR